MKEKVELFMNYKSKAVIVFSSRSIRPYTTKRILSKYYKD